MDKKIASFTSKGKAEEAAAALRTELAARQPETAIVENRAVAPAPEAQAGDAPEAPAPEAPAPEASAADTMTGEPEAQAAAPDTSAVALAAVTQEDGDEIVEVGGGDGVQGVEGVKVRKVRKVRRERAMWW